MVLYHQHHQLESAKTSLNPMLIMVDLKKKLLFVFLFLVALGHLRCCTETFPSCGGLGLLRVCHVQAPHCRGLSCCGAQARGAELQQLQHVGSVVAAHETVDFSLSHYFLNFYVVNPCPQYKILREPSQYKVSVGCGTL